MGMDLRASSRKSPKEGGENGFSKIWGGGTMHLATLMHSRLCHLLYNHVICIVGVSRGVRFVKGGGEILSRGAAAPLRSP